MESGPEMTDLLILILILTSKMCAFIEAAINVFLIVSPILISLASFLVLALVSPADLTGLERTIHINKSFIHVYSINVFWTLYFHSAVRVFTAMSLFNVMRFQLSSVPAVLTAVLDVWVRILLETWNEKVLVSHLNWVFLFLQARVSLVRIRNFMLRDEIDPSDRKTDSFNEGDKGNSVGTYSDSDVFI